MNKLYREFKNEYIKNYEHQKNKIVEEILNSYKQNSIEYKKMIDSFSNPFSKETLEKENNFLKPIKDRIKKEIKFNDLTEASIRYAFAKDFWSDNSTYDSINLNDNDIIKILNKFEETFKSIEKEKSKLILAIVDKTLLCNYNPFSIIKTKFIGNADTIICCDFIIMQDVFYRSNYNDINSLSFNDKKLIDTDLLIIQSFTEGLELNYSKYINAMTNFYLLLKKRNSLKKPTIIEIKNKENKSPEVLVKEVVMKCINNSNEFLANMITNCPCLIKF